MKFLKLSSATFLGKIMVSDHAMNAVDEMTELSNVFVGKIKESNTSISTYMELFGYLGKYT